MRATSWVSGVMVVVAASVTGCSGADAGGGEAIDDGSAAQTGALTFASGVYEQGSLELVVADGYVNGRMNESVGDPNRGGATCSFTFEGKIEGAKADLLFQDGFESTVGSIRVVAGKTGDALSARKVELKMLSSINACMRIFGDRLEQGFVLGDAKPLPAGVLGFRTVEAEKAFFHDNPEAAPRASYVVQGDQVIVTGVQMADMVPVKYVGATGKTTAGWLAAEDLAVSMANEP